jgi:hypothetical protein
MFLLASLFYVDYYILQQAIALAFGLVLCGSGTAFLVAPRLKSRGDRLSSRGDSLNVIFALVLMVLGALLLGSLPLVHYYPGQRIVMIGEGIALSIAGAVVLVLTARHSAS